MVAGALQCRERRRVTAALTAAKRIGYVTHLELGAVSWFSHLQLLSRPDGQRCIVKVRVGSPNDEAIGERWGNWLQNEKWVYESAEIDGRPAFLVPRLYSCDNNSDPMWLVLSWAEGTPAGGMLASAEILEDRNLQLIAAAILRLRSIQVRGQWLHSCRDLQIPQLGLWARNMLAPMPRIFDHRFCQALNQALGQIQWQPRLVHADLAPKNLILHPETVTIIDWETVGVGVDGFDASFLYLRTLPSAPSSASRLLTMVDSGLFPRERKGFHTAFCATLALHSVRACAMSICAYRHDLNDCHLHAATFFRRLAETALDGLGPITGMRIEDHERTAVVESISSSALIPPLRAGTRESGL